MMQEGGDEVIRSIIQQGLSQLRWMQQGQGQITPSVKLELELELELELMEEKQEEEGD